MDTTRAILANEKTKILLIESDHPARRSLQLLLQSQGYDVRAYAQDSSLVGGEPAPEAPCLIGAPEGASSVPGEILTRLRENGWHGPAILLAEAATADIVNHALAAGFTTVYEKPLRPHALVCEIARVLVSPGRIDGAVVCTHPDNCG